MGCGASRRESSVHSVKGNVLGRAGIDTERFLSTTPQGWLAGVGLGAPESEPVLQCCRQLGVRRLADLEWVSAQELTQMRAALRLAVPQRKFDRALHRLSKQWPGLACLEEASGTGSTAEAMKLAAEAPPPSRGSTDTQPVIPDGPNSGAGPATLMPSGSATEFGMGHFQLPEQQQALRWWHNQVQPPWLTPQWSPGYLPRHGPLHCADGSLHGSAGAMRCLPLPMAYGALTRAPLMPLSTGLENTSVDCMNSAPSPWYNSPVVTPQSDAAAGSVYRYADINQSRQTKYSAGTAADYREAGIYRHLGRQRPQSASSVPQPGSEPKFGASQGSSSDAAMLPPTLSRSHRPRTADVLHRQTQ